MRIYRKLCAIIFFLSLWYLFQINLSIQSCYTMIRNLRGIGDAPGKDFFEIPALVLGIKVRVRTTEASGERGESKSEFSDSVTIRKANALNPFESDHPNVRRTHQYLPKYIYAMVCPTKISMVFVVMLEMTLPRWNR